MIYCVEDERSIRELMLYTLNLSGFDAQGFEDYNGLYEAMKKEMPELIMLDIMLPGKDGIQILEELKGNPQTESIPVIMASAKGSEYDKVTGLDKGADDYLAKPFGMMEMVSRVNAVLRRSRVSKNTPMLVFGDIQIDTNRHTASVKGEPVNLTMKEYELLLFLMNNRGIVFTRDQLLEQIWGLDFLGESRTVDVHIGTLRNKLKDAGRYITTIRKVGYCLENKDE